MEHIRIEVFPNRTEATVIEQPERRDILTYRHGAAVLFYVRWGKDTKRTSERRRAAEMSAMIYMQDHYGGGAGELRRVNKARDCGCKKRKEDDPRNHMTELL